MALLVTLVNPSKQVFCQIAYVNPEEAKRLVLSEYERKKINVSWLARSMEPKRQRQTVWYWLEEQRDPEDPLVWIEMARVLAVRAPDQAVLESARDFALNVLVLTDHKALKEQAANLIREISEKSAVMR